MCALALRIDTEQRALTVYPAPVCLIRYVLGQSFAHSETQFPQGSTKQSSSSSSAYHLISDLWLMVPHVHFVHWTLDQGSVLRDAGA